jgi:copper chaperone CopZ
MRTVDWTIPAYHCSNCLLKIKNVLGEIEGIRLVRNDQSNHKITLEAPGPEALAYAKHRLAQAGYPVQPGNLSR